MFKTMNSKRYFIHGKGELKNHGFNDKFRGFLIPYLSQLSSCSEIDIGEPDEVCAFTHPSDVSDTACQLGI